MFVIDSWLTLLIGQQSAVLEVSEEFDILNAKHLRVIAPSAFVEKWPRLSNNTKGRYVRVPGPARLLSIDDARILIGQA